MAIPVFDFVVVGEGGGPDECNLSSYLFKPTSHEWSKGCLALEAGSGQGALQKSIDRDPSLFNGETQSAAEIFSFVRAYLVTHAHLDHVQSLVISAGSLSGPRKRVYAAENTLKDLETIFADRIWPQLASYDIEDEEHKLLYSPIGTTDTYEQLIPDVSARYFPVSHGHNDRGDYDSSAFFIRHDPTNQEFLFFGDVEPDSLSNAPKTIHVWRAAAAKIPTTLRTIFIECSWPSSRSDDTLYGHLSPRHFVQELETLAAGTLIFIRSTLPIAILPAAEVVRVRNAAATAASSPPASPVRPARKRQRLAPLAPDLRGALAGIRIFVIHCKDTLDGASGRPNQALIIDEINALLGPKELGVEIFPARQGMRIQI
ncbi:hypothetical protein MKEN_01066200 [Mycena kentingensis (nom. inval.)]|nr:hypothetical protein MKEN_01066200 [Mycena kentingensis (nom. inval.)]